MTEKTINGTITYQIIIKDGQYLVHYNSNQNNDIAVIGITNKMFDDMIHHFMNQKEMLKVGAGKENRKELEWVTNTLNSIKRAKAGGDKMMSMFLSTYEDYQENKEEIQKLKDEKSEEIKKFLKDNNVTIENGVMGAEEAEKLLKSKYPDLIKDSDNSSL